MPPVTAERSPPASRMTGADSPVIADSLTEATPSRISPSPGMISPASTSTTSLSLRSSALTTLTGPVEVSRIDVALGRGVGARLAQRVGLRLAAPFGDRFGEIGEQHREPQPGGDLAGERGLPVVGDEVAHEQERDDGRHDLGHEDHRVLGERPRIELAQGVDRRGADDPGVEQALRLRLVRGHGTQAFPIRTSCRRASGSARRPARATGPGNIAGGRE